MTKLSAETMYFYIHKSYTNENEQAQLLEMCSNACIRFRNGKGIYGRDQLYNLFFLKLRGKLPAQLFILVNYSGIQ